jgi:hypothetical protein
MSSPEWLREAASKVGLVKCKHKVDPVAFFWVLALGFVTGMERTLASLRRAYQTAPAKSIASSVLTTGFCRSWWPS